MKYDDGDDDDDDDDDDTAADEACERTSQDEGDKTAETSATPEDETRQNNVRDKGLGTSWLSDDHWWLSDDDLLRRLLLRLGWVVTRRSCRYLLLGVISH